MPCITYVEHNGTEHSVEIASGQTLMEGAVNNEIPGIDADCGGAASCGTCLVNIAAGWGNTLPPPEPAEQAMLDAVEHGGPGSRLSCQIVVTEDLEGMMVTMPAFQV